MGKFIAFFLGALAMWTFITYGGVRSICNDGSLSQSLGRGACSWHGGVKYDVYDLKAVITPSRMIETPN